MKKMTERGGADEWIPANELAGKLYGEEDDGDAFWKAIDDADDLDDEWEEGHPKFKVGDLVSWRDPEYPDELSKGWRVVVAPDDDGVYDPDAIYVIVNDETGSEAEVLEDELVPADVVAEGDLENELKKGDDGWKVIGQPVSETTVIVDADDVWGVLDLLSDETAKKNLTNLINSHVRTEDEIMDAIDSFVERTWGREDTTVTKRELTKMFSLWMSDIVDELGLDVEKFKASGEFVDSEKPVTLEGSEDEKKPDEVKGGEKKYKQDGETKTLVTGEKEMSALDAATIMGGASATDMDAADIGVSSHEVADPYKKPICEMTIEQDIQHAYQLVSLLWGNAKYYLEKLLTTKEFSGEAGDEEVLRAIEDMGITSLSQLNDVLSYEFETLLEALGCDLDAWNNGLEIKRA